MSFGVRYALACRLLAQEDSAEPHDKLKHIGHRQTMGERDSKDLTVLVVEDVEDVRLFMRLELEGFGFIVLEAADGRRAVDVALQQRPDVILMDLTLPVMDGFEAAKLIRKNQELKDVPIIAVTAHQGTDFRSGAKDSGFDAYVTKPIDMAWLKELIDGLLI